MLPWKIRVPSHRHLPDTHTTLLRSSPHFIFLLVFIGLFRLSPAHLCSKLSHTFPIACSQYIATVFIMFIDILLINCPKVLCLCPVSQDITVGLALRFFIASPCKSFGEGIVFCTMGHVPGWKFWVVLRHPNRNWYEDFSRNSKLHALSH